MKAVKTRPHRKYIADAAMIHSVTRRPWVLTVYFMISSVVASQNESLKQLDQVSANDWVNRVDR